MSMTKKVVSNDGFIFKTLEELVPENHLVRKLDTTIDWNFIYDEVKDLYSSVGRNSVDPVVLFKMIFINYLFGYNSMRKTCSEIEVNAAYRWFLGLSFDDVVPNYSTWSQNYIRRYQDSDIFEKIFNHIIEQAISKKYIKLDTVFGDSTHQKANANKRKSENKMVEVTRKKYEKELLEEINNDRQSIGKKPFESLNHVEIQFDEDGNETEVVDKKSIKVSTTDPECGNFHKGEHEECFAYSHQTFCDRNGFVLESVTVPGNVHDSNSFFETYEKLVLKYPTIKNICLDAGYNTPAIIREIMNHNQIPYLPYMSPKTKKGYIKKREFLYIKEFDYYVCPQDHVLKHTTTNRQGYKEYKCDNCVGCPLKSQCTQSKQKLVTRHVWEEYKEYANSLRTTAEWKEIYPKRKESIERVFADTKQNNGMRFTRLKGLKKNQNQALIIFSVHNLKRMALWDYKKAQNIVQLSYNLAQFFLFVRTKLSKKEKTSISIHKRILKY